MPPISEFMKPVFDPQAVQLPNLQDVMKQANATFTATVKDILGNIPLPPGVKLPELKLPPLNVCGAAPVRLSPWQRGHVCTTQCLGDACVHNAVLPPPPPSLIPPRPAPSPFPPNVPTPLDSLTRWRRSPSCPTSRSTPPPCPSCPPWTRCGGAGLVGGVG